MPVAAIVATLVGGFVVAPVAAHDGNRGPGRCDRPQTPGDISVDVDLDGVTYPVLVHVPGGLDRGRVPLVLNLHGSTANGSIQMDVSGARELAQREGFIVAAPNGAIPLPRDPLPADGSWAWNVPGVPTTAGQLPAPDARDDVRFISRTIDVLAQRLCTDVRRTYAMGHSGGARMSSALACRLSEKIAAIGANSGLRAGRPDPDDVSVPEIEDCTPQRAVPVVTLHGQEDVVNPYLGNADLRWGYTAPVAAQTWARINDCRRGPIATAVSEHVTLLEYTECRGDADVDFYRISNGGHTWAGAVEPAASLAGPGLTSQEIDASEIIWDFFESHRLSGRKG